jgi:hypothetical protein
MLKKFTPQIEAALIDRINEIAVQLLLPDPQYQELTTKINNSLDQIEQNLPPNKEQLLYELDKVSVERDALAYQMMYRQGLLDGIITGWVLRRSCHSLQEQGLL